MKHQVCKKMNVLHLLMSLKIVVNLIKMKVMHHNVHLHNLML
jgi:hypothetical protein